jgi:nickel-dependent lactate racemase
MQLTLAYGRTGLAVELPDDAPVTVIAPRFAPGLPDEQQAITTALRSPVGSPPLRQLAGSDDTVAVVFSDLTRPMPNDRVLPPLLAELALAGVPDERISLVNGLGTHRPQTDAELRAMLGDELVERYRIVQHDAWDEANLVATGRNRSGRMVLVNRTYMEASVRILTGFIEPHLFAGFSGGPKAVLPALADIDAILDNHGAAMIAHPRATWAVTEGQPVLNGEQFEDPSRGEYPHANPLWQEILSIAQSTEPTFILNVTLNQDRQITGVFAGDMLEAHRQGVSFVRQTALQAVAAPFDVVISSNSGYPLDLNLYQAVKGMSAAAQVVRPGGDIIVAAECWDGIPAHGEYKRLLWEADSVEALLDRVMAPGFRCHDQWEAQLQAQIQTKARVHVYADGLSDEDLQHALVIPCRSIEGTVDQIRARNPAATIAVLPDGPQTVPYVAG